MNFLRAMNMDENVYERPTEFMPDRYIKNRFGTKFDAEKDAETGRKEQYGFGLGRKICPGQWFARNTLVFSPPHPPKLQTSVKANLDISSF
jgi:cytochrome P450